MSKLSPIEHSIRHLLRHYTITEFKQNTDLILFRYHNKTNYGIWIITPFVGNNQWIGAVKKIVVLKTTGFLGSNQSYIRLKNPKFYFTTEALDKLRVMLSLL